jgi:hypothetical protein
VTSMTKVTSNDKADFDQSVFELIHGGIDGELTAAEQLELERVLAGSEQVRDFSKELKALTSLLDQVPERDPPEYLQSAIERQVRLPAANNIQGQNPGFPASWLASHWMRTGFSVAAGVVLTVAVYQMGSESFTTGDTANMVGTVVKSQVAGTGELLDSIHFNEETLSGLVELRNEGDLFTLDIQLNSDGPAEVVVDFAGRGLEFAGVNREHDFNEKISVKDGLINIASQGEQRYSLLLRSTSEAAQAAPLELDFFTNNKLVHKAGLNVSQQ